MVRRLPKKFYARDTCTAACDLLGKALVCSGAHGVRCVGIINETEAYCGPHDTACHASKGRTGRTEVMFGPPGHWYVYLIYGMYHCLNAVTERPDYPAAVLIRGVVPLRGVPAGVRTDGPGKLCRAFQIDKAGFNSTPAYGRTARLWVEDRGIRVPPDAVQATARINVHYAGKYKDKPWRFVVAQADLPV